MERSAFLTFAFLVFCPVLCTGSTGLPDIVLKNAISAKMYDFDKLSNLIKRLDILEKAAPEIMLNFYEPHLYSFSVRPGGLNNRRRVCVTNSCYSLLTIVLSPGVYDSVVTYEDIHPSPHTEHHNSEISEEDGHSQKNLIPIKPILRTLVASEWREDDLFQVPLLLYTLLRIDSDRSLIRSIVEEDSISPKANEKSTNYVCMAERIRKMISVVLDSRPQRRHGPQQQHSDYISYQICKVIALLQESTESPAAAHSSKTVEKNLNTTEKTNSTDLTISIGGLPDDVIPPNLASEMFWALLRCSEVGWNELCRQLAYRTAGDTNSFDVIRLAYSLLTYIRATHSLSGIAGRELVHGQGASPDTKVAPLNHKLVSAALAAFFGEQNHDGLWSQGQPIYMSFGRGKGRNMGNAFVFSVNTIGSLLCSLPAESFRPYLNELEKTLSWIENHQTVEMMTDYVDPETCQCYGRPLRGWSSPHMSPSAGPQAWPTAQVLKCVSWLKKTIQQLMHNDALEEFGGISYSSDGIQPSSWDNLLDSDIGDPSNENCRSIKSVLEERVINPFANSIDNPSYGAAYSAILFGPPGTAKTSICQALAQRMGYDFCVIDTAAFLADGLTNVAARIRYIFSRLMALNECIILFDEIEEFALDRETPGLSMESRMLTTAMLTAINDLRKNQKSIFFVATNRLRAFDSAITRRGRFDMQLFIGTPNLESRIIQFEQQLSGRADEGAREAAIEMYRTFLESVWTQDAMYMNYLEGVQFATACADVVASRKKITLKEMSSIFRQQKEVMTVRGSAREEYLANMVLSRL